MANKATSHIPELPSFPILNEVKLSFHKKKQDRYKKAYINFIFNY